MSQMSTGLGHYEKQAQSDDQPPPLAVPPPEAARLLSLSVSRIYQMMRSGELKNYTDGRTRRIPMVSIHDYVARRLAASADNWQQWPHNPRAAATKNTAAPSRRRRQAPPKRRAKARANQPELFAE